MREAVGIVLLALQVGLLAIFIVRSECRRRRWKREIAEVQAEDEQLYPRASRNKEFL